jgi:hypothetical protein
MADELDSEAAKYEKKEKVPVGSLRPQDRS